MSNFFGSPITREIWSDPEHIVLIYAGSAADFALNAENDWLFYTMRLPQHPQQRFIETFAYNQRVFFSPKNDVSEIAKRIRAIHEKIEQSRSEHAGCVKRITEKAFGEVGDMLIDYGIRAWEYLHRRRMSTGDRSRYASDMLAFISLMDIHGLPLNYEEWLARRERSVRDNLAPNPFTAKLYMAYRTDIGAVAYWILKQFQKRFAHPVVAKKLLLQKNPVFSPVYKLYPYMRPLGLFWLLGFLFLKPSVRRMLKKMRDAA